MKDFDNITFKIRGENGVITEYTPDGNRTNTSTTDTYTINILDVYKFVFKIIDTKVHCDVYKKEHSQKQYKLQYTTKQLQNNIGLGEYKLEFFYASEFDNKTKNICKKKVENCLKFDINSLW